MRAGTRGHGMQRMRRSANNAPARGGTGFARDTESIARGCNGPATNAPERKQCTGARATGCRNAPARRGQDSAKSAPERRQCAGVQGNGDAKDAPERKRCTDAQWQRSVGMRRKCIKCTGAHVHHAQGTGCWEGIGVRGNGEAWMQRRHRSLPLHGKATECKAARGATAGQGLPLALSGNTVARAAQSAPALDRASMLQRCAKAMHIVRAGAMLVRKGGGCQHGAERGGRPQRKTHCPSP